MSMRPKSGQPTAAQKRAAGRTVSAAVRNERERFRENLLEFIDRMKTSTCPMFSDINLHNYHNGWNAALELVRAAVQSKDVAP